MFHKRDGDFRPQACYRDLFTFNMISGIVFTVVGLLFKETKAMFLCGCMSVGLAFLFGYNNGFKHLVTCEGIPFVLCPLYTGGNERTDSTRHDSNNRNKSCRGNDNAVPTNDTVHIAKDYTDLCIEAACVCLRVVWYLTLMFVITTIFFYAAVALGFFYPKHKNLFLFAVCGFTLLLRTWVYTKMYRKTDRDVLPQACYRDSFIFHMIPGMVFTVVGLLFKETKAMYLCGCISIGLALLFRCKACYRGSFILHLIPGMVIAVADVFFKASNAMFLFGCISIGLAFLFGNKGFKNLVTCKVIFI